LSATSRPMCASWRGTDDARRCDRPPAHPRNSAARHLAAPAVLLSRVVSGAAGTPAEARPRLQETLPPASRTARSEPHAREAKGRYQRAARHGAGWHRRVVVPRPRRAHRPRRGAQAALPAAMEADGGRLGRRHFGRRGRGSSAKARITGLLEHPGDRPGYEIGRRDDGTLYYTQKLIRGRTLTEELKHCATAPGAAAHAAHFVTSARTRTRTGRGDDPPRHQARQR